MITAHCDISYSLIDGLYDALYGNVTLDGVSIPVYKSIPKPGANTYILINQVNYIENGTKDYFIYEGTVNVVICDDSAQRGDKKKSQQILGIVRGLLKPSRLSVPSLPGGLTIDSEIITIDSEVYTVDGGTDITLVSFTPGIYNEFIEQSETGYSKVRLIDTYNFIIA